MQRFAAGKLLRALARLPVMIKVYEDANGVRAGQATCCTAKPQRGLRICIFINRLLQDVLSFFLIPPRNILLL
jgi:hypothetical protein